MTDQYQSTLYLLSGNGSTHAWWEDTLPHFKIKKPVSLELPGFGENTSPNFHSLQELAQALLEMTEPGHEIFAVGINGLVVLHALVLRPGHFKKVYLLAPVGAFLWERSFARIMAIKPVHKIIHWLLGRFPKLFKHKFSSKTWTEAQYARMGKGYSKCRAFGAYFDFVRADTALDMFEWITDPIELIWGRGDAVLGIAQAAAWDSILPRADLGITLKDNWEHYPYIDDPKGFVAYIEAPEPGFRAHTKAGRLSLASLAGLPVPNQWSAGSMEELNQFAANLKPQKLYAVRSSGASEDHIDHSNAGLNDTFLRVPANKVAERVKESLGTGLARVVVQEFIEPKVSGVAFVRFLGMEVEMVAGHLEEFISGKVNPIRVIQNKMGTDWEQSEPLPKEITGSGFALKALGKFLQKAIKAFHYAHSDLEWAWDGDQFHLLQIRPVTAYDWRRSLTSANLDEILPKEVSRIMEYAQRRASLGIPRVYAKWDSRILNDNEPFSVLYRDASFINNDVFLSRFHDWGLPGDLYAQEIGGAVPKIPFRPLRFLLNVPRFLKMQRVSRGALSGIEAHIRRFAKEFEILASQGKTKDRNQRIADWFARYYLFIVRTNMLVNAAISSGFGNLFKPPKTIYQNLSAENAPHRLQYESDPATPRPEVEIPEIATFPEWPGNIRLLSKLGAPGLRGYYIQVREWFRDNNMRLFFNLHHALKGTDWLQPFPGKREVSGSFWQDGGVTTQQGFSFTIYPGTVTGIAGEEIMVVDALEPGHYEAYKAAKAVISRTGGKLSHGATLLRELKKPSAVISDFSDALMGKEITLRDGKIA